MALQSMQKKEINQRTKEAMIQKKSGKGESYKDETHLEARGKEKSIETVKYAAELHADISMKMKTPKYAEVYDRIVKKLTVESEGYDNVRAELTFEQFLERTKERKGKNKEGLVAT